MSARPDTHLAQWRARILQNTLVATAVLATIAYIPSMIISAANDLLLLQVVDTLVWVFVMVLALWRRLPFNVRAGGFVAVWFLFGVLLVWMIGPVGAGTIWLLSVPIITALFFGYAGVGVGVGLMVLVSVAFTLVLPLHQAGGPAVEGPTWDLGSWLATASSLIFLAALLSLAIARLLVGLERSLLDLSESNRRVSNMLAERENLQSELLRSQKQSALGTLASGIAHDFNNVLVPILIASEEARDEAPPDSRQRRHLDNVIASATRARNLVRRILEFSRSPSVERRPVAVAPLLREVGALLRSSAPAGIDIRYRIDAPDAHVLAEPGELHQILLNLGTNAYLAMKDGGGTLTLSLHRPEPGRVQLDVEDTGAGIPPELHDRIFDPFFTTRGPGSGTGLGLAIVHRLVTAMAGALSFDSVPGRGTRFSVMFDEAEPDLAAGPFDASETRAESADGGRKGQVLVVDDEELVRGLLVVILSRAGYGVREAASPESALRQVHDDPSGVDLVITDLAMPGMNGLQLAGTLRTVRAELPVILTSGYLSDNDRERVGAMAIDGVLEKPFSRRSVIELVEQVLGAAGPPPD